MPTYEYECQKCGTVHEVFHGMTEEGPKRCKKPKCRGKLKKLISAGSGLIFKGSGFYITDYKKKSGAEEGEKSEESSESKKSEDKKKPESGSSKDKAESDSKPSKKD